MKNEYHKLESQSVRLRQEIEKLPSWKLISGRNGKYRQWYQSDGYNKKYIPKKNRELIEKLAIKKFLSYQLEDIINEKRAIGYCHRHHCYVTSTQLKQKECLSKQCHHLEKQEHDSVSLSFTWYCSCPRSTSISGIRKQQSKRKRRESHCLEKRYSKHEFRGLCRPKPH